jgi:excisionase family DNA binding protein
VTEAVITPPEIHDRLLTVDQVAKRLVCSRDSVFSLVRSERLPCINISGSKNKRFRFKESDVESFISTPYVPERFVYNVPERDGKPVNIAHEIAVASLRKKGFKI